MSRHDNYPDDIRSFDNVPGSPFYVDPNEWMEERADELAAEWDKELSETGIIEWNGFDQQEILFEMSERKCESVYETLQVLALEEIESNPDAWNPEPDYSEDQY